MSRRRRSPRCARAAFAPTRRCPTRRTTSRTRRSTTPVAVMFGNEHAGLSAAAIAACNGSVTVPMFGFTESFNLSVTVGLAMSRIAARRRAYITAPGDLDPARLAPPARAVVRAQDPRRGRRGGADPRRDVFAEPRRVWQTDRNRGIIHGHEHGYPSLQKPRSDMQKLQKPQPVRPRPRWLQIVKWLVIARRRRRRDRVRDRRVRVLALRPRSEAAEPREARRLPPQAGHRDPRRQRSPRRRAV